MMPWFCRVSGAATFILLFAVSFSLRAEAPDTAISYRTFTLDIVEVIVDRKTDKPINNLAPKKTILGRSIRVLDKTQNKAYDITIYDLDTSYTRAAHYSLLRSVKGPTDDPKIVRYENWQMRISWTGATLRASSVEAIYLAEDQGNGDALFKVAEADTKEAILIHTESLPGGVETSSYKTQNAYVPLSAETAMTSNISTYAFTPSTRDEVLKKIDPKIVTAIEVFEKAFNESPDKGAELDEKFKALLPLEILPRPRSSIRPSFSRKNIGHL